MTYLRNDCALYVLISGGFIGREVAFEDFSLRLGRTMVRSDLSERLLICTRLLPLRIALRRLSAISASCCSLSEARSAAIWASLASSELDSSLGAGISLDGCSLVTCRKFNNIRNRNDGKFRLYTNQQELARSLQQLHLTGGGSGDHWRRRQH